MPESYKIAQSVISPREVIAAPELIGREDDMRTVLTTLQHARCVTLAGPGGMGKTALALHVAAKARPLFVDGVYTIALADVCLESEFLLSIVLALNIKLDANPDWATQIIQHIHQKSMLIVLDNFEQLIPFASHLQRILAQTASVRLLITSRESLKICGEQTINITGVSLASTGETLSPAERIFEHYAQRARPSFHVASDNRASVQRICALSDGMPLAIELAASWVTLLPIHFIASQIEQNLDWLTTSLGFTHREQKSVRAVLDYFWQTLSPDDQRHVQTLSVFVDGFDDDMADEVAHAPTSLLSTLVERSFLTKKSGDAGPRYAMHPLLKQYAADKFRAEPAAARAARERHAQAMLTLAQHANSQLYGPQHSLWTRRLIIESANFRAAFVWWLDQPDTRANENAHKLVQALCTHWYENGFVSEGRQWIKRAIETSSEKSPLMADTLHEAARFSASQDDFEESRQHSQAALALAEGWQDVKRISTVLHDLALNESYVGNFQYAIALYERVLVLDRERNDQRGYAIGIHNMAMSYFGIGDNIRAEAMLRDSLANARELKSVIGAGYSVARLINVLFELNRECEMIPDLVDTLEVYTQSDNVLGSVLAIEASALLLTRTPEHIVAVTLFGQAAHLRTQHRINIAVRVRDQYAKAHTALRTTLGDEHFTQSWQAGQALGRQEALMLAHQKLSELARSAHELVLDE
jgi:non-specific serine/threonine protein kinase